MAVLDRKGLATAVGRSIEARSSNKDSLDVRRPQETEIPCENDSPSREPRQALSPQAMDRVSRLVLPQAGYARNGTKYKEREAIELNSRAHSYKGKELRFEKCFS